MNTDNFNPDGVGSANAGIFGLNYSVDEAKVVLIPAPWVRWGWGSIARPEQLGCEAGSRKFLAKNYA